MLGEAPVSSPSLRKDADAKADADANSDADADSDAVGRFHSPRFTCEGKKGWLSQRGPEPGFKSRPVASAKPRHIRAGLFWDLVRSGEAVTPLPPEEAVTLLASEPLLPQLLLPCGELTVHSIWGHPGLSRRGFPRFRAL